MRQRIFVRPGLVFGVFALVYAYGCDNDDGSGYGTKGSTDTTSIVTTDTVDSATDDSGNNGPTDISTSTDVDSAETSDDTDAAELDTSDTTEFTDATIDGGADTQEPDDATGDSQSGGITTPVMANGNIDIYGYLFYNQEIGGELGPQSFAGYILSAHQGAKLKVDLASLDPEVQFALFVFGPAEGAEFLDPPLVWSESSVGATPSVSFVSELNGKYLVVAAHNAPQHTSFTMLATCEGESCGTATFVSLPCPPDFVDDISACITDLYLDPENAPETPQEASALCADAEPLANAYDNQCKGPERPLFCGADYGLFWGDITNQCSDAGFYAYVGKECLFGARFIDLFAPDSQVVITDDTWYYPESLPDPLTEAQILLAVGSKVNNINDYVAAILATDNNQVRRVEVVDLARRVFTVIEFGLGDTSVGIVFQQGTTDVVATFNDGDFTTCSVQHTLAGTPCVDDVDCGTYQCVGQWDNIGRCADATQSPGEGASCSKATLTPCTPGLVCAGLSTGDEGICVAPWMVDTFFQLPVASITDEGITTRSIQVSGLATVTMDVHLKVTVSHWDVSQISITLTNPAGTEVPIYAGDSNGTALSLDLPVIGFPGDESANGLWTIKVIDSIPGGIGTLDYWTLMLTSRLD